MVNDALGKMGRETALTIVRSTDFYLVPFTLTGNKPKDNDYSTRHGRALRAIKPNERDLMDLVLRDQEPFLVVDYTTGEAAEANAQLYATHDLNFVMGTTGAERSRLVDIVKKSQSVAVISPNMCQEIVALQELIERFSLENPGILRGCSLYVEESHQAGKADTSGTAKAMIEHFKMLGIEDRAITNIRDVKEQRKMGIPEEYLGAHGWHTYDISSKVHNEGLTRLALAIETFISKNELFTDYNREGAKSEQDADITVRRTSSDGTRYFDIEHTPVKPLIFRHNINGRRPYALGTLDALKFLQRKLHTGERGRVYSMIDVIEERQAA